MYRLTMIVGAVGFAASVCTLILFAESRAERFRRRRSRRRKKMMKDRRRG